MCWPHLFLTVVLAKKLLLCIGCSNHQNNFYIWLILFYIDKILLVNWIFLTPTMYIFYRPDLCLLKWVLLVKKLGLNPGNVGSCYKIVVRTLTVGYSLWLPWKTYFWTWSVHYALLSFERIFSQRILLLAL